MFLNGSLGLQSQRGVTSILGLLVSVASLGHCRTSPSKLVVSTESLDSMKSAEASACLWVSKRGVPTGLRLSSFQSFAERSASVEEPTQSRLAVSNAERSS